MIRLDKYLRHQSAYSRSQVQKLIRQQRVQVNGEYVSNVNTKIATTDTVHLDGTVMTPIKPRYFMLHKPQGAVCTNSTDNTCDSACSVLTLLNEPRSQELIIVGRLDKDTTGLVLITDDGQWAHKITAPRKKCAKCYQVQTADPIPADTVQRFAQGIHLRNDTDLTQPATLTLIDTHNAWLTLTEGRYHQVKRMFGAVGNRVVGLHRHSVGTIVLDAQLTLGQYRPLTPLEIQAGL